MISEILAFARQVEKPPLPSNISIEPTSYCNLKCKFCPHSKPDGLERPNGYMSMELFTKIIDEVKEFAKTVSLFLGGEGTLHKNFPEMVEYSTNAGLFTRLYTNGTTMNKSLAKKILEAKIDSITFSFDAPDKETYESTRVGANYDKTLTNIENFLNLRNILDPTTKVTLLIVDTPENHNKIQKFIDRYSCLDVGFKINHLISYGGFAETYPDRNQYFSCKHPWQSFNVLWNGDVVPCCIDIEGKMVLHNINMKEIYKKNTIREIWHGESYVKLRKMLKSGRLRGLCALCDTPYEDPYKKYSARASFLFNLIKCDTFHKVPKLDGVSFKCNNCGTIMGQKFYRNKGLFFIKCQRCGSGKLKLIKNE